MALISVRPFGDADRSWAGALIARHQGTRLTARLGELLDPLELPGLVATSSGRRVGLATLRLAGDDLEVLTLHSAESGHGAGSALVAALVELARQRSVRRVWLVTTNDNLAAIRFYLRRGFRIVTVHEHAVATDRRLKPSLPLVNEENGIAIRDLVEFAVEPQSWTPLTTPFPTVEDLDGLPAEACQAELAALFGRAPRFLASLVVRRPFETDDELIGAAYALARELPEPEVIELVNARPFEPVGAPGADREPPPDDDDEGGPADDAWVEEELGALADVYRDRFGFDFAVFDAGRPRADIIPLLEASLRNDRDPELRRAAADCVALAEYRLRSLRGASPGHVVDEE